MFAFKKNKDKKKAETHTKLERVDTEFSATTKSKKPKNKIEQGQKTHKIQRFSTNPVLQSTATIGKQPKTIIHIKQLLEALWQMKNTFDEEYDCLLNNKLPKKKQQMLSLFLGTHFFRFRAADWYSVINQYGNVLQSLELLISKLTNNQKLTDKLFIRNQEDFVLFFKFFFSKPYTLINRIAVRKIIKVLWDRYVFTSFTVAKQIFNIRLWIHGISFPLNPSMNKLHQLCIDSPGDISKHIMHRKNSCIYVGINDSDALGLTPLMVAATAHNIESIKKLIKNGCDASTCPLTKDKVMNHSCQQTKHNKLLISKTTVRQRKQYDPIEILRQKKQFESIGDVVYYEAISKVNALKKDKSINEMLSNFPDCSFIIDWKEIKGMICFKQLPQDIITVFKRDTSLRIDFHLENVEKVKGGHFSILFKGQQEGNKLYLITHHQKKIVEITQEYNIPQIKLKYSNTLSYGNIYHEDINKLKAIYSPKEDRISIGLQTSYTNIIKAPLHKFSTVDQYIEETMNSKVVNYSDLEKSEKKMLIEQKIQEEANVKSKVCKSQANVDVDWIEEKLNLTHLRVVLELTSLAYPSSIVLEKIKLISKAFDDLLLKDIGLAKKLPLKAKLTTDCDLSLQAEIKNLNYLAVDPSAFKVEVRAKELNYEEVENNEINRLEETLFMEEIYSINASRFLGRSERILSLEDEEANRKFQELLKFEHLWQCDDD